MMRTSRTIAGLLATAAAVTAAGCASSSKPAGAGTQLLKAAAPAAKPVVSSAAAAAAATSTSAFGLDLYRLMGATDQNTMISPASLVTLLAMVMPGARGQTEAQMASALHTQLPADRFAAALGSLGSAAVQRATGDKATLDQSNTVWAQKGFGIQPSYLDVLSGAFDAGMRETDFRGDPDGARQAVNSLVADQTHGYIKNLFPKNAINSSTVLALTDAVYFKADWAAKFKAEGTSPQPFHLPDGTTASVPTMTQAESFRYASGQGWQAVELPYQGGHLAMDVLLPASGTFDSFRQGLDASQLTSVLGALQPSMVELSLPKFTFDDGATLNDLLQKLGMTALFSQSADLGGIASDGTQVQVSQVVEKTHVAVDEDGTTAAAAAGAAIVPSSAMEPVGLTVMDVDRPFVFLIRDTVSGQVLFLGQVTHPGS